MTPVVLVKELERAVSAFTADMLLPVRTKPNEPPAMKPPDVSTMSLTEKGHDDNKVPYVIIQLINGYDGQEPGQEPDSRCRVRIIACVYSTDNSEGGMMILNLLTRIRVALLSYPILADTFKVRMPLEYLVYPDNIAPYFSGEMTTIWSMPPINPILDEGGQPPWQTTTIRSPEQP